MTSRDPFEDFEIGTEDSERTIILPSPGGARQAAAAPSSAPSITPSRQQPAPLQVGSNRNALLAAAAPAFILTRQLRRTAHHEDPEGLRQGALRMIRTFEETARRNGASPQAIHAGRYALCAMIDEAVLATPWGSASIWSGQSLLGTLHNETHGGAKFFGILSKMMKQPSEHLDLLELLYACLALGFQGKFAVMERGVAQLADVTQSLYETIRRFRASPDRELSPNWRGAEDRRPKAAKYIPLWVVPVAVCGFALIGFLSFSHFINRTSDTVYAELNALVQAPPPLTGNQAAIVRQLVPPLNTSQDGTPPPSLYERVNAALGPEQDQGRLSLRDEGARIRIVIRNQGLFASGSARVSDSHAPLIRRVAEALRGAPSPVRVIGHTDSQPIRTVKFPSNWHLSSARAEAVTQLMAQVLQQSADLITEGRAEAEPLAGNDTAEGRALNRRIEITVPAR